MIRYEREYQAIKVIIDGLYTQARARFVILIDRNGQQIASSGNALEYAAVEFTNTESVYKRLVQSLSQESFSIVEQTMSGSLYLYSLVADRVILGVLLGQVADKTQVRLRMRRTSQKLAAAFKKIIEEIECERAEDIDQFEPPDSSGGSNSPPPAGPFIN